MVLGFENIALQTHLGSQARKHLVGDGADIEERLMGRNQFGKARGLADARSMLHGAIASRAAIDGMEHAETDAICEKRRSRSARHGEPYCTVLPAFDTAIPGERDLALAVCDGELDAEPIGALRDTLVRNPAGYRAPARVAQSHIDLAKHFHSAAADVAERA